MPLITDYQIFWEYTVVLSNFYFVIPIITSFYVKLNFHGVLFALTWVMSCYYHLCATSHAICIAKEESLHSWDHVYSGTMVVVLAFQVSYFLFKIPLYIEITVISLSFIIIFTSVNIVTFWGTFTIYHYVALVIAFFLVIVFVIYKSIKETRQFKRFEVGRHFLESSKKIDHPTLYFSGLCVLGLAFLMFTLPYLYEVCHSLWHMLSAIGFSLIHVSMKDYLVEWRRARKEKILYILLFEKRKKQKWRKRRRRRRRRRMTK